MYRAEELGAAPVKFATVEELGLLPVPEYTVE